MKDLRGYPVEVGDLVAYVAPTYHEQRFGVVQKVTPKGVRVDDINRQSCQFIIIILPETADQRRRDAFDAGVRWQQSMSK